MITRDDILKEIRKTAEENGGTPLGVSRFKKITGIKPYDWHHFWARFGDAQREAGLSATTLVAAYDDEYLFEKFIILMRELKKWPTKDDIRVKIHSTLGYPSDSTFLRLGNKQKFAIKLLSYAKDKKYDDVIKICDAVLEEFASKEDQSEELPDSLTIGSVYLVMSGKYYKIGRTNNMDRRHQEITIILPEGLSLIHEIKTDDPGGIENYWHRRFESKRKNGEWFDLNSSDVKAFKRWRRIV